MLGMSGFAAWFFLFLVPSGIYLAAALRGARDASRRPAVGRATAAFVIAYPLCMGVFYAWAMGVFFA